MPDSTDIGRIMHTVTPSGNAGSIIHPTPNSTGRNTSSGLPKVSGGMPAHPSHINNLSAAVDKNTVKSFVGGLVRQNNGGTTIEMGGTSADHPFKVSLVGSKVQMRVGCVFNGGTGGCDIKQYYPNWSGATLSIFRGGDFLLPEGSKSAWDDSITVTKSGDADAGVITFPLGDATKPKYVWMDCITSPPTLKCTDGFSGSAGMAYAVPIAYINNGMVIQIVKENFTAVKPKPLQIHLSAEDEGGTTKTYIKVTAGTVNNKVPTLNGKSLTDPTAKQLLPTTDGLHYVWIRCPYAVAPTPFPNGIPQIVVNQNSNQADTEEDGYLALGVLSVVGNNAGVLNYLNGSVRGEAHKYYNGVPSYLFYGI